MIINPQIPLHRLVLSLSQSLDCVHPLIVDHQQRTAYIAIKIARQLGKDKDQLLDIFLAAALHDIGLIGVENRISGIHAGNFEDISWHGRAGFELLKDISLFSNAAPLIRFHHVSWDNGTGVQQDGDEVPFNSHILVLADFLERTIDRNFNVLDQAESLTEKVISLKNGSSG